MEELRKRFEDYSDQPSFYLSGSAMQTRLATVCKVGTTCIPESKKPFESANPRADCLPAFQTDAQNGHDLPGAGIVPLGAALQRAGQ
jgi:hypothetical protein